MEGGYDYKASEFNRVTGLSRLELEVPDRSLNDMHRKRHAVSHLARLRQRGEKFGCGNIGR